MSTFFISSLTTQASPPGRTLQAEEVTGSGEWTVRSLSRSAPGDALAVADCHADPNVFCMSYGRVNVGVTWVNPYSGLGGTAGVLPQNDEFAYFYYSDPKNPEVFVKVLGDNDPNFIQLFVGGTTDFEYTVTFSGCGTVVTYHKPPYVYTGTVSASAIPNPSCARGTVWAAPSPVTSLNGLTGALTLAGGTGITVTPTAGTLTIASTSTGGITGVSAGTGLTGGGTSGNVTLGIATGGVKSSELAASAVTTPKLAASAVMSGAIASGQVVKTLNGLTDGVTLAAGSNVTITPSGNTLTIASSGGSGTRLPSGTTGQTLYHDGTAWVASSALTNTGVKIAISGTLSLPATTALDGQILLGSSRFLHNYGPALAGNTFVGEDAGNFTMGGPGTDDGKFNTAFGFESLSSNTTGRHDTASGHRSLSSNTTGLYNTANGSGSLRNNTTGGANTASGYRSLSSNTTGLYNTANGFRSLYFSTTGDSNTASGADSLYHNTTGSKNTAVGSFALFNQAYDNGGTPYDSSNTAIGYQALYTNNPTAPTNGIQNTAVGMLAIFSNSTGNYNTAVGYRSLNLNTGGYSNTAIGFQAGDSNVSGFGNTFLGAYSDAAANDLTNATAIGYGAIVDASDHVRIGNASVIQIGGQVAWSNLSDARAKTDIRDLELGLNFVLQLRPVAFRMRHGNGRTDMGFLAQDVEALLGDGYNVVDVGGDENRTLSLRYTDLIAPLVKAVQEQQREIAELRKELASLRAERSATTSGR